MEEYLRFAKEILKKKRDKRIEEIVKEIEKLKDGFIGHKLRELMVKILELSISKTALDLARYLSVIDGLIVKNVAERVYSKKFPNYLELMNELICNSIVIDNGETITINKVIKDVLEEDKREYHEMAIEYYRNLPNSLDNLTELAYHYLKAGLIDNALNTFINTANMINIKHRCIDKLIMVGEKILRHVESDDKVRIIGTIGNLYMVSKKYNEAEDCYKTVLKYYIEKAEKDNSYLKFVAGVLNNLGNLYFSKGEFSKAEESYKECLKIRMEQNDEDGMVTVLLSLADLYIHYNNYENAEKCYYDALRIELKKNRLVNVASIVNNLGYLYRRMGKLDKAEKFYREAIRLYGELVKDKKDILNNLITALSNLSSLYMSMGKVDNATELLEEIKKYWDIMPIDLKATYYLILARSLESKNDPRAAEYYLKAGALGFILFRNYSVTVVNFMHCLDKAEQLGSEELKGDATIIKAAILKKYYGVRDFPEVQKFSIRGEAIIKAMRGEDVKIDVKDEIDMIVHVLINDLKH
ncbi:MAG TPA: tetratricopeptide repeat protein [Archaeoglobus profundus]|nr:tetratricopeptide repeat protein [Archaeoglobus profundus]